MKVVVKRVVIENEEFALIKDTCERGVYFNLAKRKLDISKTRSVVGKHSGKLRKQTAAMTLEQFLSAHPHIRNNLYGNASDLVNGKNYALLSDKLKASYKWANEQSLYKILSHYDEIISS